MKIKQHLLVNTSGSINLIGACSIGDSSLGYGIEPQPISGALRMKLIKIRNILIKQSEEVNEAISQLQDEFYQKANGTFVKDKKGDLIIRTDKSVDDFNSQVEGVLNTEIDLKLDLLTESEFGSLSVNSDSLFCLVDSKLNPLLSE